jgi:hypothetical protein
MINLVYNKKLSVRNNLLHSVYGIELCWKNQITTSFD